MTIQVALIRLHGLGYHSIAAKLRTGFAFVALDQEFLSNMSQHASREMQVTVVQVSETSALILHSPTEQSIFLLDREMMCPRIEVMAEVML